MVPSAASQETDTLVKRLAGPSSGKAGLALDQSDINKIIAEASKGSAYYTNEKKKDKDLTERIARILKHRDSVVNGVDMGKIESKVDDMISEIETARDITQFIVHVDMDAFFASVEVLWNPDLKGKPFGVGHGVLTTASYEARKYGVRSGMAGFIAMKLCPHLILVDIKGERYGDMSKRVMDVFKRYDPTMCPAGCDEGYLNITPYCEEHNMTPDECVEEMRAKVFEETSLTVSAGIAPNKMLAKICSDKNKPNGQFHLPFDSSSIIAFMKDLSIRKIPGIGRVNERLLESIGIKTCGDIYTHRATISLMDKEFGLTFLLRTHLGIASNVVSPGLREETKSIGYERTFSTMEDKDKILAKLEEVATELEEDMSTNGWMGHTITLKYKLDTYQVFTRAKTFTRWISKKEDLFETGKKLLLAEMPLKLRLIGMRVTKLKDLRAKEGHTGGIKRFFTSPTKKRKTEGSGSDVLPIMVDDEGDDQDELPKMDVDAMPGFHEEQEDDIQLLDAPPAGSPVKKPQSTTNVVASSSKEQQPPKKPKSAKKRPLTPETELHECPICAKVLETDNQGLNAHVDFCLSKGAIREAQGNPGNVKKWKVVKEEKKEGGWQWPSSEDNAGKRKRTKKE